MKKDILILILSALLTLTLSGCGGSAPAAAAPEVLAESMKESKSMSAPYAADTPIADVINDPAFGDYGRLIFPVDTGYYSGDALGELHLTWYNNIDPDKTVEIANYMRAHAEAGDTIFYDIYTDEEKASDPAKKDTGLFFFRGDPGERFAICNAGGGFAYVGAMHDSFPHALELSKMGYNAFALIYRPGAQTACEDLARAIQFIFEHADELEVDTACYSLWGGSAGARMAAHLGSYGPEGFGGGDLPRPGAVIMQYTGHSEYTVSDPPTYACVGTNDGIANWRTMERRLEALETQGISTEFHAYSTYADSTDLEGLAASRDHRAFGGFSMGSMNTWRTFEHCLDYFCYFAPSSGGPIGSGEAMADLVRGSGHEPNDFFIFAASGTEDFAYSGFKSGVMDMGETDIFTFASNERDGNLAFREREGYAHDGRAANEYMYNALRFFWNKDSK